MQRHLGICILGKDNNSSNKKDNKDYLSVYCAFYSEFFCVWTLWVFKKTLWSNHHINAYLNNKDYETKGSVVTYISHGNRTHILLCVV